MTRAWKARQSCDPDRAVRAVSSRESSISPGAGRRTTALELPARPAGPIERAIAEHVARLIPDRATIELGLGAIPEAVTHALGGKCGLGVHSRAIGDEIADLMEAGIVDNRHKESISGSPSRRC